MTISIAKMRFSAADTKIAERSGLTSTHPEMVTLSVAVPSSVTKSSSIDSCRNNVLEVQHMIEDGICNVKACDIDQGDEKDQKRSCDAARFQFYVTAIMCAMCMIINSSLSFFLVEKKRLWTQGHVLPFWSDVAEFGFLISVFTSISGSIIACVREDWVWFLPGCISLLISTSIYLIQSSVKH